MRPFGSSRHAALILGLLMGAVAWGDGTLAIAASGSWLGTTDASWSGTNWTATPAPGSGDTATFNADAATVNNNTTIDLGSGVTLGSVLFSTTAKTLTFAGTISGGTGGTGLTLVNMASGTVTLSGPVTSTLNTLQSTGTSPVIVAGQTATVASLSEFAATSTTGAFDLQSRSVAFNSGVSTHPSSHTGSLVKVTVGTLTGVSGVVVALGGNRLSTGSFTSVTATGTYGGLTFTNSSGVWTAQVGNQEISFAESTGDVIFVPEPATVASAAAGMLACFAAVRRRKRIG